VRAPARVLAATGGLLLAATAVPSQSASAVAAADPIAVTYQPPVEAPMVDAFRPPDEPWGAGNRGIEYATDTGSPVVSSAAGVVTFAGSIAGATHVVVLHADGIRSSYSFLASSVVTRGQQVVAGQLLGLTGSRLHFGARAGDAYINPLVLFEAPRGRAHLIPDRPDRQPAGEAEERGALARWLRSVPASAITIGRGALDWAAGATGPAAGADPAALLSGLRAWTHQVDALSPEGWIWAGVGAVDDWMAQRGRCTPTSELPRPVASRRLAVLVGGLGSASGHGSILSVDTAALGYAPGDVVQSSYRGGTATEHPYGPIDTQQPLATSAAQLRALLERLHAQHPDVPIDVMAHSQGGPVARLALGEAAPAGVATLTTLGSPHAGADLATAADLLAGSDTGRAALRLGAGAARLAGSELQPDTGSIQELSEYSTTIAALAALRPPPDVRMTSIAARADVVVTSPRTRLSGAARVVVSVPGLDDHTRLPGSPAATREIALALAGQPPTCQSFLTVATAAAAGHALAAAEDGVGATLAAGAHLAGRSHFPAAW
jgi:murein DD-endopeptidase MepM/ murein hydrolase activator NlpD